MARHVLGIDVGTSGTKALIIDDSGRIAATATADHACLYPRPGWSEQRPDDWWKSVRSATRRVLRRAKLGQSDIAGVGLSGQMHGSVFLDARGRPITNALLWNDQRTSAECEELETHCGGREALIGLVRNTALTGYQAPKILWLRRHKPRLFARVRTILLPKDYIRFRLTGTLGGDVSDASGTLLFDVARRCWSHDLMERLELDPDLFPPVCESQDVVGQITSSAAAEIGLKAGIPVVAGAGDQAAAAIGTGVVRKGLVSATIGTSGVVFAHSDSAVPNDDGLLQSFCHAVPGAWCVFGCMLSAGGSLQWARSVLMSDGLRKAGSGAERDAIYDAMIREAATSNGDDRLVFLPYLTGERCPYPHPHARGAWIGLTARHTRGDLLRAVLEGITLGMGRQLQIMRSQGVKMREIRLAGGAARSGWWRQLQADVYGVRCLQMRSEEGSALGAAILAAVGAGLFRNLRTACASAVGSKEAYRPNAARNKRYQALARTGADLYERLEPLYRRAF